MHVLLSDDHQARGRLLHAGAVVCLLVASALAIWAAARLFWSVVGLQDPTVARPVVRTPPPGTRPVQPGTDVAALHLFGQAGLTPTASMPEAPETALALTLLGTAAAEDPADGLAIVADESGAQGFFAAGDELPGGATLRAIYPDRIEFEHRGRRESLRLERDPGARRTGPGASAVAAGRRDRDGPPGEASGQRIDWNAARAAARIDPEQLRQLGQQIRALPFTENGKPIGVRLIASRDASLLHRLGLRSSDIIMAVNGIPLSDPSRQLELMGLLNSQSQFQVRLRRNGNDLTVNVDARKLQDPAR